MCNLTCFTLYIFIPNNSQADKITDSFFYIDFLQCDVFLEHCPYNFHIWQWKSCWNDLRDLWHSKSLDRSHSGLLPWLSLPAKAPIVCRGDFTVRSTEERVVTLVNRKSSHEGLSFLKPASSSLLPLCLRGHRSLPPPERFNPSAWMLPDSINLPSVSCKSFVYLFIFYSRYIFYV